MVEKLYTPPPVTGYRKLTQTEVDLMNKIKGAGNALAGIIDEVQAHIRLTRGSTALSPDDEPTVEGFDTLERLIHAEPARWLSIGRTDLQRGLMEITRAVAQPTGF